MEITGLSAVPVAMDLRSREDGGVAPYVGSATTVDRVERVLVRLETEAGVTGWGELRPELGIEPTVAIIEKTIAQRVVGRDINSMQSFRSDPLYAEYTSIAPFVAAVETAMWDAYARSIDEPLHRLLGGKCVERVQFADVLGILDPDTSREYATRALERGFDVLKLKGGPPNSGWRNDVKRVVAMHDAVDGALEFRLDSNGSWSASDAIRLGAALEDRGIQLQYLEQPVTTGAPGSYRSLRHRLRTPIAVNEDTYHKGNLATLIQRDAVDIAVVDLVPSGGILAVRDLVAVAAEAGLSVTHHCGFDLGIKTAAILHFVSATPAVDLPPDLAYQHWADCLIRERLEVVEGSIAVPDRPGLGVSVDPAKLAEYRID